MPRKKLEKLMQQLNEELADMSIQVEEILEKTIAILISCDKTEASATVCNDSAVNSAEHTIQRMCMELVTLQQPVATDMRVITSTLKIITDIERVADQCADICEIIASGQIYNGNPLLENAVRMLESAKSMFCRGCDAYIRRDERLAAKIIEQDDDIDAAFAKIISLTAERISNGVNDPMNEIDIIIIAKYIERIADHATNIAEWVSFVKTGACAQ